MSPGLAFATQLADTRLAAALLVAATVTSPTAQPLRREARLVPAGASPVDQFGHAVAVDGDRALVGGRALVGAYRADSAGDPDPYDDTGAACAFSDVATAAGAVPTATAATLSAPSPNPTAGRAALTLRLAAPATVRALLVDALGRTVAVLYDRLAGAETTPAVDARGLPPGVYAVRVLGARVAASRRLTVVR